MTASPRSARGSQTGLDLAVDRLTDISSTLLESYEALARRAQHVEEELSRTNAELECKVNELDATTRHLEAILEALPTGVVVLDAEEVVRVNAAALEILGGAAPCELFRHSAQEEPCEFQRPDGEVRAVASRRSSIRAGDGMVQGSVWILDDRTEFEQLTERVHRMDKMAALGTMAGGIAHEIRNPMNAIRGFASLLRKGMQEDTKQRRWASLICEGVDEVDAIITSMLTFAEPERLRLETVDGPALVEEAVDAVRRSLTGERWTIAIDVVDVTFRGDHIKLRQAIRNLVSNAVDAQPDGGAVRVALACDDGEVTVSVTDDGPGIPREVLGRVSDPFFTTRAEGTGLGLALVHTIARLHGGRFEITSRPAPEHGALAVIRVPLSPVSRD